MMKRVFVLLLLCGMAWGQHVKPENCFLHGPVWQCPEIKPEPEDVPAIYFKPKCKGGCVAPPPYWTCTDKLRVLEHDESEPPHYYCRKPQTESK
jgi:hypothetical protein